MLGLDEVKYEYPSTIAREDTQFFEGDIVREPGNAHTFSFIRIDDEAREITALPGNWNISEDLIIPKGYVFVMGPGTTLELLNDAQIISHSPLRWIGEESRPIMIRGASVQAKGLAVLQVAERSQLTHVRFEGLSAPRSGSWQMTGAVVFYESPVDFSSCFFRDNHSSDDALNVVRSPFTLRNSRFENIYSDAFDIDFSNGTIEDMTVSGAANDGIDMSGSDVRVVRYTGSNLGDKGMSIGENSSLDAQSVSITNAHIGIASKDLSHADVNTVQIERSEIGLALYQKKSEFGPSQLSVTKIIMKDNGIDVMVEAKSRLSIDEEIQPASLSNVAGKIDL